MVAQKEPLNKNWKLAGLIFGLLTIGALFGWYFNQSQMQISATPPQIEAVKTETISENNTAVLAQEEASNDSEEQAKKEEEELLPAQNEPTKPNKEKITKKEGTNSSQEIKITKSKISSPTQKAYDFIEATPKDGMDKLYEYLNSNLKYPTAVSSEKISGEVIVNFTIDKKGSIQNIQIEKSLGEYFWTPKQFRVIKTIARVETCNNKRAKH